MPNLKTKIELEKKNFQHYIDEGLFNYDSEKDMTLGYVDMTAEEVLKKIKQWDFSPLDNLVWHYARITLLNELLNEEESCQV